MVKSYVDILTTSLGGIAVQLLCQILTELSVESVDILIVASQANIHLLETVTNESENPEGVKNPQNMPQVTQNVDPPNMPADPPNTSVYSPSL